MNNKEMELYKIMINKVNLLIKKEKLDIELLKYYNNPIYIKRKSDKFIFGDIVDYNLNAVLTFLCGLEFGLNHRKVS